MLNTPTPEALVPTQAMSVEQGKVTEWLADAICYFKDQKRFAETRWIAEQHHERWLAIEAASKLFALSHGPAAKGAEREALERIAGTDPKRVGGNAKHSQWCRDTAQEALTAAPASPSPAALGGDGVPAEPWGYGWYQNGGKKMASGYLPTIDYPLSEDVSEGPFPLYLAAPKAPAAPIRDPGDGAHALSDIRYVDGLQTHIDEGGQVSAKNVADLIAMVRWSASRVSGQIETDQSSVANSITDGAALSPSAGAGDSALERMTALDEQIEADHPGWMTGKSAESNQQSALGDRGAA